MSAPKDIPGANAPPSTPPLSSSNPFKRLVRSLSRSRGNNYDNARSSAQTPGTPPAQAVPGTTLESIPVRSSSKRGDASAAAALSTSPPPDSYFPQPPRATMQDSEASGRARHPDSYGQRATDAGENHTGQAAPGVTFAPSRPDVGARSTSSSGANGNAKLPASELDSWNPLPRRSQSQRHQASTSPGNGGGGLSRKESRQQRQARAGNGEDRVGDESAPALLPALPAGDRQGVQLEDKASNTVPSRGVQLEDKPLSRKTSVKRAASAVKRAFTLPAPGDRTDGEVRVLVLVADGSEEIETMTVFDVCVRAGLTTTVISVSPQFSPSQSLPYVTLSRGAKMMADTQWETLRQEHKDDFDAVIIPGGAKGAERLSQDREVQRLLRAFHDQGKLVGMICAGVLAAKTSGIALGQRLTSHPSVKGELEKHYRYSEDRVVVSGNLVTSRGPGTAIEWALTIVGILAGQEKRDEVAGPMML